MKILVVDDISTNRKLLRVTLGAEEHQILEAADGVEALAVLARERVDAVISDILMPNMDGFRLCNEIRKSKTLHALPFIIYTSTYNSPDDIKLAETVGADKYLTKPASAEEVLRALREVVGKSAARPAMMAAPAEEAYVLTSLACDALSGVNQAVKPQPDLIILDISMPAGSGFDVAERIRNLLPKATPIIFLTASKRPGLRQRARELGAVAIFEEPYIGAELLAAVRAALGESIGLAGNDPVSRPKG